MREVAVWVGGRMGGYGDDDVVHTRIRFRAVGVEQFLVLWLLVRLVMVASFQVSGRHLTAFGSGLSHGFSPPSSLSCIVLPRLFFGRSVLPC